MYALVKTGGKQYRVSKDDTILVERLSAQEGEQIILNDIVMLGENSSSETSQKGTPSLPPAQPPPTQEFRAPIKSAACAAFPTTPKFHKTPTII